MKGKTLSAERRRKLILSVVLAVICVIYVLPMVTVVLNSFKLNTFYGRTGWEGVGQAKAVVFFILVVGIGLLQLRATRSKEVQQ